MEVFTPRMTFFLINSAYIINILLIFAQVIGSRSERLKTPTVEHRQHVLSNYCEIRGLNDART